jgi:rSAM/selenodomain-associated transferase 1
MPDMTTRAGRPCLAVFVKAPRPGAVKTRLAADIGSDVAAELYRAMADRVMAATRPEAGEYDRLVFFTPPDAAPEIETWLRGETCLAQQGEGLGARMAAAFAHAFAGGASSVVLIGSDAPDVARAHVAGALRALASNDVVIGPSIDGGYALIALARPQPWLFDGMAWSTPAVLEQTLDRARRMKLRAQLLGPLADIDTLADLRREWAAIRSWLPSSLGHRVALRLS